MLRLADMETKDMSSSATGEVEVVAVLVPTDEAIRDTAFECAGNWAFFCGDLPALAEKLDSLLEGEPWTHDSDAGQSGQQPSVGRSFNIGDVSIDCRVAINFVNCDRHEP